MRGMYYRDQPGAGWLTPVCKGLMIAIVAVFVVQLVADRLLGGLFTSVFALGSSGFLRGWFWQFATYLFLHGGPIHLLLNLAGLFFFGPEIERLGGRRHFLGIFLASGILGGAAWLALTYPSGIRCLGASGAVLGLLGAYAVLWPDTPIGLLFLPFSIRAKYLAVIFVLIDLAYLMSPDQGGVAYAAHVGGILVGAAYAWLVMRRDRSWAWLRRARLRADAGRRAASGHTLNAEIDRILDKVAREGIHRLTAQERKKLEDASRR